MPYEVLHNLFNNFRFADEVDEEEQIADEWEEEEEEAEPKVQFFSHGLFPKDLCHFNLMLVANCHSLAMEGMEEELS